MRLRTFLSLVFLAGTTLLPAATPCRDDAGRGAALHARGGGSSGHRSTPGTGRGAGAGYDGTHSGPGSGSDHRGSEDPWDDDGWYEDGPWRLLRWLLPH